MSRITYDFDGEGPPPDVGSVLVSTKTGRCWEVVATRQVRSRKHPQRFSLTVRRVESPEYGPTYTLVWKGRRKPAPLFGGSR